MKATNHIKAIFLLLIIFSLCVFIYFPGLSGGFLFDDFSNLLTLGQFGPIDNIDAFKLYITSGVSGPTGRPISLLSFLIDARNWPTDPWPFKRTSLIIHLLNGLLLYFLFLKTLQILQYSQKHSITIALLACLMWTIHPLFVSTVLYPVQRMAQLSAFFMISGLLFYISLRSAFLKKPSTRLIFILSAGIPLFILLAIFSKENGALLPLLILVYEFIIIKQIDSKNLKNRQYSYWFNAFVMFPSLLILAYLIKTALSFDANYMTRDFTLYERLLSESSILLDYLYQLIIPHSATHGVFNDNIAYATTFLSPKTFFSVLTIVLIIFIAIKVRKKNPLFSLAFLFFFMAHIMESSVIMLELYYEHRNYLPSIFLFLPIASFLVTSPKLERQYKISLITIIIIILSFITYSRASLWSSPLMQSAVWSAANPTSQRAQTVYALNLQLSGHFSEAEEIFKKATAIYPDNLLLRLNYFNSRCTQNKISQDETTKLINSITPNNYASQNIYKHVITLIETQCSDIDLNDIEKIIEKLTPVNNKSKLNTSIAYLYARLKLKQKQPDEALKYYKLSLIANPSYQKVLAQSSQLASNKYFTQTLELLDLFSTIPAKKPSNFLLKVRNYYTDDYFEKEIIRMKRLIQDDIKSEAVSKNID